MGLVSWVEREYIEHAYTISIMNLLEPCCTVSHPHSHNGEFGRFFSYSHFYFHSFPRSPYSYSASFSRRLIHLTCLRSMRSAPRGIARLGLHRACIKCCVYKLSDASTLHFLLQNPISDTSSSSFSKPVTQSTSATPADGHG